jgi:hypothetical protein
VRNGIGEVFSFVMKDHIDRNRGRGADGGEVSHAPLKQMHGERWVDKPRANELVVATRTRSVPVKRKVRGVEQIRLVTKTEYKVRTSSYRNNGQPLRDTGKMYRGLNSKVSKKNDTTLSVTLRGPIYALFQDKGFKTSGPNFIPLTRKAARGHGTGNNPNAEGLKRGKDFIMAWRGVTVPSRPFLLPTRKEMRMVGKTIYQSLKTVLKGR